ncbi:MAG: hypothetical protein WCP35_11995 [Verrucomicrobiota bacterium]
MIFPRHTTVLIGGSAESGSFLAGTPTLLTEQPTLTQDGWDSLTATFALRCASLTAEALAAIWPIGTQYGERNWWVTGSRPTCIAPGVWTAAVDYKGFAAAKPTSITWGSSADIYKSTNPGPPVGMTDPDKLAAWASYMSVETTEANPTFTHKYITTNVSATPEEGGPPTSSLGASLIAAAMNQPTVGDSRWANLTKYVYHFPNGWVLMSVTADILPGTSVALVTETYKYVPSITPG